MDQNVDCQFGGSEHPFKVIRIQIVPLPKLHLAAMLMFTQDTNVLSPYPHIPSGKAGTSGIQPPEPEWTRPGDASFDIPVPALADPHQAAD